MTGQEFLLRCRGQVTPAARRITYEVFVSELSADPYPTLYADVLGTVDRVKGFHARRAGLRLVPDWPVDHWRKLGPPVAQPTGEPMPLPALGGLRGADMAAERDRAALAGGVRQDYAGAALLRLEAVQRGDRAGVRAIRRCPPGTVISFVRSDQHRGCPGRPITS